MAWVLDLDGVVWLAGRAIPGSVEAVARLRAAGEPLAFVTNNSYLPRAEVAAALARIGVDPGDDVLTSSMAAARLVEPGETVLLCAGPGAAEELEARGARVVRDGPADAVVVGYHRDFDYARMTAATRAVLGGARLIATNDDSTYPTPEGLLPGGGAILASIATASGATPLVAGKPHTPMAELVRARLGATGVVVGDRFDTDGGFARTLGWRFGLVLSGVTGPDAVPELGPDDLVAADLGAIVDRVLAER